MNFHWSTIVRFALVVLVTIGVVRAQSEQQWYGGADDVAFAEDLWGAMRQARLVGDDATAGNPYVGTHPHGAILEVDMQTITVRGVASEVVSKRSYRGIGATIEDVQADRASFIQDVTVMFKREAGYDPIAQDWFWAKYNPDGTLDATPNGVQLAGRIAKGKPKGCIACHLKAAGGDLLFVN